MRFLLHILGDALDVLASGDTKLLATTVRTLVFAAASTSIALVIGVPIALFLAERPTRGRRAGLVLANAGLGLPPVVLGVFLALALLPGAPLGALSWTGTLQAVILAQVLLSLPIVVALTASAVRALPAGLTDQASAFGASRPAVAALAVREARIGVTAAVITASGAAVAEVGAVVIVGGNIRDHTNTLASTVLLDLAATEPARAAADVIVLVAVVLLLGGVLTLAQQGIRRRTIPAVQGRPW